MQPVGVRKVYSYVLKHNVKGNPCTIRITLVLSITLTVLASSKFNRGGNIPPQSPKGSFVLVVPCNQSHSNLS